MVPTLGIEQRFLPGKPLAADVASGDRWAFRSTLSRFARGRRGPVGDRPLRLRRRGGEVVRVAATVEPLHDDGGREAEPAAATAYASVLAAALELAAGAPGFG